jgi:hypothetical protein
MRFFNQIMLRMLSASGRVIDPSEAYHFPRPNLKVMNKDGIFIRSWIRFIFYTSNGCSFPSMKNMYNHIDKEYINLSIYSRKFLVPSFRRSIIKNITNSLQTDMTIIISVLNN